MTTPRSQRIGIWIIAAVMVVGSIGIYFVAILANNNDSSQQQNLQQIYETYLAEIEAQAAELSVQYFAAFAPYASRVHSFEKATAQEKLVSEDLVVGTGDEITGETAFAVYYIGWNENGKIFDQSIDNGALQSPLSITSGLNEASLIEGWKEGLIGMKIGGVRELTIPSDKAYGSTSPSEDIPADAPLKFIVMAIPLPAAVPIPAELLAGQ